MGQDISTINQPANKPISQQKYESYSYAPVATHRTEASFSRNATTNSNFYSGNNNNSNYRSATTTTSGNLGIPLSEHSAPLLNTAYYGKWSMEMTRSIAPMPRIGQCSVYDPVTDSLIIAYGTNSRGQCLNDCWALQLRPILQWRLITHNLLSPREYPSAVLDKRKMYIFGGANGSVFYSDLHSIDLDNGKIEIINVSGRLPVPRTSPALFASDHHLYLWAGFDGRAHGGIYRIRPKIGEWHRFDTSHTGVPCPAFCAHKGKYYIFGGMTGTPISTFDPENGTFAPFTCSGTEPAHELTHSSLVPVDEYIFLVGGESTVKYMHIYALDVKRHWWFAFHIRPDNESLSVSDGAVNKVGLFMLPREYSCSVAYSPRTRELVSVMGSKMIDPPPIFKVSLGQSLAQLHLRNDMLDLFLVDHGNK